MKVQSILVSDDVRQELGNKISLVGIYDAINFPPATPWPVSIPLGLFMRLEIGSADRLFDVLTISFLVNGKEAESISGAVQIVDRDQPLTVFTKIPLFKFDEPGSLKFNLTMKSGNEVVGSLSPDYSLPIKNLPA